MGLGWIVLTKWGRRKASRSARWPAWVKALGGLASSRVRLILTMGQAYPDTSGDEEETRDTYCRIEEG
jgi:hypothetical protein